MSRIVTLAFALTLAACGEAPTAPDLAPPPVAAQCELLVDECAPSPGGPGRVEVGVQWHWRFIDGGTTYSFRAQLWDLSLGSNRVRFTSPDNAFRSCEGRARSAGHGSFEASCNVGRGFHCGRTYAVDVTYSYTDEQGYARWITVREHIQVC